jgi:hypothetical protein
LDYAGIRDAVMFNDLIGIKPQSGLLATTTSFAETADPKARPRSVSGVSPERRP